MKNNLVTINIKHIIEGGGGDGERIQEGEKLPDSFVAKFS